MRKTLLFRANPADPLTWKRLFKSRSKTNSQWFRNSFSAFFFLMTVGLFTPSLLGAQTPQGSLTANGPFCGSGAGMLTWTASAGTGPFTLIYNDGMSNRTVTNVVSGVPFNVFITPVTINTTYSLVSVTGSDAASRSAGFTGGSTSITIKPKPDVTATPSSQTVCSGASFTTIDLTSSSGGTTFSWTRDNIAGITGTGGVSVFSGTGNISGAFTNTSATPGTIGFQVVPTLNGCAGNPLPVTVKVNPTPTVTNLSTQTFCPGANTTLISFSGTATSFTWTNNNTSIGLPASGTGNISSFVATNSTSAQKTATIAVTPVYTNAGTCNGIPQNFSININPAPALNSPTAPTSICNGTAFNYTPTSNATGITPIFSWTRAAVSGISNAAGSGTGPISDTLYNTTNSVKNVTYVFTVSAESNGVSCVNPTTFNVVEAVKPSPTVSVSPSSKQTICSGSNMTPVNINNPNNVAGTSFSWTRTRGSLSTGNIIGMESSGTGSPIAGELTNTTLTNDTTIFTATATAGGCSASTSFLVVVTAGIIDNKLLGAQISEVSVCGLPKQITIASVRPKGGNGPFTFQWQVSSPNNNSFANIPGATDSNLVYFTNNNAYFRRLAFSGNCKDTSVVKFVDAPGANNSSIQGSCTGGSGMDISVVASYVGAIYKLQNDKTGVWLDVAGQDPITGTGNSISFENNKLTGLYRVVVTVPGNCTEIVSGTAEITTATLPDKPISTSAIPSVICQGTSASIFAIVPGATPENGAAVNWYTVPSGGSGISVDPVPSGQPFIVSPDTTTTYYAKSIFVSTGCKSSNRTPVTVVVNKTTAMTSIDSIGICSGGTLSIPLTDSVGVGTAYSWIAQDNPNITGESLTIQNSAVLNNTLINNSNVSQTVLYQVTPKITATGCSGNTQIVKVTVAPASKLLPQAATICSGEEFLFAPSNGGGNIVTPGTIYTWAAPTGSGFTGGADGSDTTIHGALMNTGTVNATATYSVVPSSGDCTGAAFTATITIKPAPFIANQAVSICNGTFSLPPFTGSGNIIPAGTTYSWAPPTGTNLSGIAAGSNQAVISGNLVNTSVPSVPVTATYIVTPAVGGCEGSPFTLKVNLNFAPAANTAVWTGFNGSDWCDAANWACGIMPNSTLDAIIPSGSTNEPQITGSCNAAVRDLDVRGTATLNLGAGASLDIFRSIINIDPARYTFDGNVTFAGGNQDIPGFTYAGLGITGGGTKTLLGAATVNGNLTLNNGIIKTTNAMMLTISTSGNAGSGSNLSYVDGPLTRLTNSNAGYNFPVGGNGDVRPAIITPVNTTASSYTVYYHYAATAGNVPGPALTAVQSNEYWDIMRNSGADAMFGMYYKNPNALAADAATGDWSNGMNPCNGCNVAVVWKDGSDNWNFTGSSGGFGPDQATFWQANNFVNSRQMLGTSGQFSFGYANSTILASQLLSFTGVLQGSTAQLEWKFALGSDIASTEIQHSANGRKFEKIALIEADNKDSYSYGHQGIQPGAHFYRLYIKEKTGGFSYSRTILLISGKSITVIKGIRPTLVRNLAYADIQSAVNQEVQATIVDITGRTIARQNGALVAGENNFRVNTQMLMPGMYTIRLQTVDGAVATFKFVKEK